MHVDSAEFEVTQVRLDSPAPGRWDRVAVVALVVIVLTWGALFWGTWGHWGNVTIDSGREVYVPGVLAEGGKTLYKDIWYLYGPLGPYFNAMLFKMFGTRLETAYWAGSLAALGSAILIFLAAKYAGVLPSGWITAMLILVQSFVPSLFCFPFPYSFAAVYGCLVSCAFFYVLLRAMEEPGYVWTFVAGCLASIGFLLKLEYGVALYGGLAALLLHRVHLRRSWRAFLLDLATAIPGVMVAVIVTVWMIQLGGLDFLLHENIMSWPSAYFMQKFGTLWLKHTIGGGTAESPLQFLAMFAAYILFWVCVRSGLVAVRQKRWPDLAAMVLVSGIVVFGFLLTAAAAFRTRDLIYWMAIPKFMPVLLGIGVCGAFYLWIKGKGGRLAPLLTVAGFFTLLLCFRLAIGVEAFAQSIYYNPPIVVMFLPLLSWLVTPADGDSPRLKRFATTQSVIGIGTLLLVVRSLSVLYEGNPGTVPLRTDRGSIYVSRDYADGYGETLRWIAAETAKGSKVMSLPEDTTLYFLSHTEAPTRVFTTGPGTLAPGPMTEKFINEIETKEVTHILWSNRTFGEYGVPHFGEDFDKPVGDYIRSRFEPTVQIPAKAAANEWHVIVWRRKGDNKQIP